MKVNDHKPMNIPLTSHPELTKEDWYEVYILTKAYYGNLHRIVARAMEDMEEE